jgi:hypothetical protein
MIVLRRARWLLPVALGALTVAVIGAVIVARSERPSRALIEATPGILKTERGTPPEIAAINAQLAQIQALHAGATYGPGLTQVVDSPVPGLRPVLGEEWRKLGGSVGRVWIRPTGTPSRYFEVSMVAVAQHGPARLEMLTSEGQRAIEPARTSPFQVVNFGPLLAPGRGGVGLALSSVQPQNASPGPTLLLSPLQAEYLGPGQWVRSMPALAEIGPGGVRGVYLPGGSTTRFAMTPGVRGGCTLTLQEASVGGAAQIAVAVGSEVRSASVGTRPAVIHIGPFKGASSVLSLKVTAPSARTNTELFISDMRFVAAPS